MRYFKLSKLFSKLCYEPYKMQFGSSRYHDFHTRESTSKNVEKMESNFSYNAMDSTEIHGLMKIENRYKIF